MSLALLALVLGLPLGQAKIKLAVSAPEAVLRPGKPMKLRFTIENPASVETSIEEPENYLEGLEIRDEAGQSIKAPGKPKGASLRSVSVPPLGFFGRTVDISSVLQVPAEKEGFYRLRWSLGDAASNEIQVVVVRDWLATVETSLGTFTLEFRPDLAPHHVLNFLRHARSGFYGGSLFHRIIAGFMMQGGKPRDSAQAQKDPLKAEFSAVRHGFGTLSAARGPSPDSATSEFFICFGPVPHLDGQYSVFGQVHSGEEVIKEIEKVKTDHSPCAGCGMASRKPGSNSCCGQPGHHEDRPQADLSITRITLSERK